MQVKQKKKSILPVELVERFDLIVKALFASFPALVDD